MADITVFKTVFQNSHTTLKWWFWVFEWVGSMKEVVSKSWVLIQSTSKD